MPSRREADVRFYFDADILGVAHVVAKLRNDSTYPGDPGAVIDGRKRPSCIVTEPSTPDDVWIPKVAAAGWSIITRDSKIKSRPGERQAVIDSRARLIVIASPGTLTKWDQLRVLLRRWDDIELLSEIPGPFIAALTASRYRWVLEPVGQSAPGRFCATS